MTDLSLHSGLPDAEISYDSRFIGQLAADSYFHRLLNSLNWTQYSVKIFGKKIPQPRLTALYASNDRAYSYSGLNLQPAEFTQELLELQQKLKKATGISFTHCLANLYRSGTDSMGWHADDEKELGKNPPIASLSFGAKRKFQLKHKKRPLKHELELEHGSLLLMTGSTQHFWKHQIPKTAKPVLPRINLTFRKLVK